MTDETVLISGETGTGKEPAAKTIFEMSASHTRNFVLVNCAAVVGPLFESMFFGHAKGSFTAATKQRSRKGKYSHFKPDLDFDHFLKRTKWDEIPIL